VIKVTFADGPSVVKCEGFINTEQNKNRMNEGKDEGSKKCEVQSSPKRRLIIFNIMQKRNSTDSDRDNNLITDMACRLHYRACLLDGSITLRPIVYVNIYELLCAKLNEIHIGILITNSTSDTENDRKSIQYCQPLRFCVSDRFVFTCYPYRTQNRMNSSLHKRGFLQAVKGMPKYYFEKGN